MQWQYSVASPPPSDYPDYVPESPPPVNSLGSNITEAVTLQRHLHCQVVRLACKM